MIDTIYLNSAIFEIQDHLVGTELSIDSISSKAASAGYDSAALSAMATCLDQMEKKALRKNLRLGK